MMAADSKWFGRRAGPTRRIDRPRGSSENQPRRNEEHEDFFLFFFVPFVSSWLIFIVSGRRSLRHEQLLLCKIEGDHFVKINGRYHQAYHAAGFTIDRRFSADEEVRFADAATVRHSN